MFMAAAVAAFFVSVAASITLSYFGNGLCVFMQILWFAWKTRLVMQAIKFNKGNFPFSLHLQKGKSNCSGPHTVISRCLLGQSRFSCGSSLLPISMRHSSLSPLLVQLILPLFIIQDILFFLIILPSYYVSGSRPLLDHHVTALIWGCYSALRCSLS